MKCILVSPLFRVLALAVIVAGSALSLPDLLSAQNGGTIFSFPKGGSGGYGPQSGVVIDDAGNIYGTTPYGGIIDDCSNPDNYGCGVVYELSRTSTGWQQEILHTFTGADDGGVPIGGLVRDEHGNFYGTGSVGGASGAGVVFELSSSGGAWNESTLYSFTGGADGGGPYVGVTLDSAGNIYGTTEAGGNTGSNCIQEGIVGCGVVFELKHSATGGWDYNVIHTFNSISEGSFPLGLAFNSSGTLFGTTDLGGTYDEGTVFEMKHGAAGWAFNVIHNFTGGTDGGIPGAGVVIDSAGDLYGTTIKDGSSTGGGPGVIYKMTPEANGGWSFLSSTLADSAYPYDSLLLDTSGDIYGTAFGGGVINGCYRLGCGVVFKFTPNTDGWTETILHIFRDTGGDGGWPYGNLVFNSQGKLVGTTDIGGTGNDGTVFQIEP